MTTSLNPDTDSTQTSALSYISDDRFHKRFELPATADHADLTLSYADAGRMPATDGTGPQPATILFMPGMFASRYLGVAFHAIAEKLGVRVLIVDRPGMGHSTDVPLHQRISVWVELVPRLLAHLGIAHVALASHSAGTIYLLNTLSCCRHVLHPDTPFMALLAPWVDPSHSRNTPMRITQYLPAGCFSIWHHIPRFFITQAGPALASSGAVFSRLSTVVSPRAVAAGQESSQLERNRRRIEERYGVSREMQTELDDLVLKAIFGEQTVGANSEALMCLRKGPAWTWGTCDDYELFLRELVALERNRQQADSGSSQRPAKRLKVRIYFAETDAMIGKRGQSYVEQCWRGNGDSEYGDVFDFEATTVDGTDHDNLVQSINVLERVFIDAGGVGFP